MDQRKLLVDAFSWHTNREFWKWVGGFTAFLVLFYIAVLAVGFSMPAIFKDPMSAAAASGALSALGIGVVLSILAILAVSVFVYVKILAIALKQNSLPSNPITLLSLAKFALLSLLLFAAICILLGTTIIGFIVSTTLISISGFKLPSIAWFALYMLAVLAVMLYVGSRLSLAGVHFWAKQGCGILESARFSLKATKGREREIIVAQLLLLIAFMVVLLSFYIYLAIAVVAGVLLSIALAAISSYLLIIPTILAVLFYLALLLAQQAAAFGVQSYWLVGLYKQLVASPAQAQGGIKSKPLAKPPAPKRAQKKKE